MNEETNTTQTPQNTNKTNEVVNSGKKALDAAKNGGKAVVDKVKEFSKRDFGKFKGQHVLIVGAVVLVLLLIVLMSGGSKGTKYPIVYNNSDGELYLLPNNAKDEEDAIKLSGDDSTSNVLYANTTDKYLLFLKGSDLYLYKSNDKEETEKLVSDVDDYYFTEDDKYVIALDDDDNLYSYDFGKEKEKLDTDVSYIYDYTNEKIVYSKDDTVYVRSLKAKKDDKNKITDDYKRDLQFSEDGKNVLYVNGDGELMSYSISKKENTKIAGDVSSYYCDEKSCNKLYYVVSDGGSNLYYYNGKESSKVASDISTVMAVDVDSQKVVYTKVDDNKYTLYYQNGTKDAAKIEGDLDSVSSVRMYEGKGIYYVNSEDELRYVKISGAKVSDPKTVEDEIETTLNSKLNGYFFVADVDKNGNGTLYFASNGKAKEIDTDVSYISLSTSKDGKKVYYLKDYKTTGDLYVTSGGKGKKIESDVRTYSVINPKLIYLLKDYSSSKERGDLYRSNGSKSTKIAENVTRFAHPPVYYQEGK